MLPAVTSSLVPGGHGTRALLHDSRLTEWLRARAETAELLLSVCTGALLLGSAGLLVDRDATTHHDAYDELVSLSPRTSVQRGRRVVPSTDRIHTSAGISAGIDASLGVVEKLAGAELRQRVADEMEWMWQDRAERPCPTPGPLDADPHAGRGKSRVVPRHTSARTPPSQDDVTSERATP